jgi:hypothetical protein
MLSHLEGITKEQIDILPHALERDFITAEWIFNCILSNEIRGILQQRDFRYRIYYKHPIKEYRYDLVIIIDVITSKTCIKVVTTYEQSIGKRVR